MRGKGRETEGEKKIKETGALFGGNARYDIRKNDPMTHNDNPKEPGAYFLNFSLENVRSFGARQTLRLTDQQGSPARWTIILGNNGAGKTTLLRGLAAIGAFAHYIPPFTRPNVPVRGISGMPKVRASTGAGKTGLIQNYINSLLGVDWLYFGRDAKPEATLQYEYVLATGFDQKPGSDSTAGDRGPHQTTLTILAGQPYALSENVHALDRLNCYGYGAARRIGSSAITNSPAYFPAAGLFNDEAPLLNAEEWLIQADYRALREDNARLAKAHDRVMNILRTLLRGEVSDIRIESKIRVPQVQFKTHYGWVPLHELSLGYKTLIAWMVDFASRMLERYEDAENPLGQPAVVLIDEIDLHLHPKLQRELINYLTETFPQTQFIATAHSPLIAQAAEGANLVLLQRKGNQVIIDNDPANIRNWRVDQILTSDLFGLESARSPGTAKLLEERTKILSKRTLSGRDEKRLKQLEDLIGELPVGDTPAEQRAFSVIDRIALLLENPQKPAGTDAPNESAK
jgi:hypothetical protein